MALSRAESLAHRLVLVGTRKNNSEAPRGNLPTAHIKHARRDARRHRGVLEGGAAWQVAHRHRAETSDQEKQVRGRVPPTPLLRIENMGGRMLVATDDP